MVSRVLAILAVFGTAFLLVPLISGVTPLEELPTLAASYAEGAPESVGAQNLVTAIIVTLRGLDTLGEVAVLFIAATGVGFLLSGGSAAARGESEPEDRRAPSEILSTGSGFLYPILLLFGVYVFLHGHLTPGGGFQGGVIIASALILVRLGKGRLPASHGTLGATEAVAGSFYVALGVLGLVLGGGFLDNRILPLGEFGALLSAGAIPVIYTAIGIKVGAELTAILEHLGATDGKEHP